MNAWYLYVLGPILGTGDAAMNKTEKVPMLFKEVTHTKQ